MTGKFQFFLKLLRGKSKVNLDTGSFISPGVRKNEIEMSGKIRIEDNTFLERSALTGEISIGKNAKITESLISGKITIGNNSKIIDGVELAGEIEVGRFTSINGPNTDLRCRLNPIRIGSFCSIARNVTFQEFNHDFTRLTSYFVNHNMLGKSTREDIVSKGPIIIENDVWIGTHSIILSGVRIGTGAVVAANTVVAKDVPPYAIVGGNPAKVIKFRFDQATIDQLLASEWWDKPEADILELYRSFGSRSNPAQDS
ncbi:MAG: CatB-related O-acetyltransferase [Bacteroidia bacterium]